MRYTLVLLLAAWATTAVAQEKSGEVARTAFSHALPKLDGSHLAATVIEVTYGPGSGSNPHRHPCPVIGYVVSGSLRSNDSTYTAGQAFYEAPLAEHYQSMNASKTEPVTFLAYFICDRTTPLMVSP